MIYLFVIIYWIIYYYLFITLWLFIELLFMINLTWGLEKIDWNPMNSNETDAIDLPDGRTEAHGNPKRAKFRKIQET